MSDSLGPRGLQHVRLPCPSPSPRVCLNSCPLSRWSHPTILSSVISFSSCLQSFTASESFPMSQFFASGGQGIGASASASVFPMHIQYRFPLGWTGLISLPLKSLLQHHSWKASVLWHSAFCHGPTLTSILDCWRNHSFDYTDLCQQSDASAF